MTVKEPPTYEINRSLTLRLEDGETIIYVNGQKFRQCKYLFIVEPNRLGVNEIDSIDEASELLSREMEPDFTDKDLDITPEEMFWGHCSNLQAWAKHDYDTRLLHSNLAFPLLEELAELGDMRARRVFKEEIAKRYINGTNKTRNFLSVRGYLDLLSAEELTAIIGPDLTAIISEIGKEIDQSLRLIHGPISGQGDAYQIENGVIIKLKISGVKSKHKGRIPKPVKKLTKLKYLCCSSFDLENIPEWINNMTDLRELQLVQNNLEEIIDLKLPKLVKLNLSYNKLRSVDFSGCVLPNLRVLNMNDNQLTNIKGFSSVSNVRVLSLWRNQITTLPEEFILAKK
jgi:hypothetical protein